MIQTVDNALTRRPMLQNPAKSPVFAAQKPKEAPAADGRQYRRTLLLPFALMAAMMPAVFARSGQAQSFTDGDGIARMSRPMDIDATEHPSVSRASETPWINQQEDTQTVYDVKNIPLLSESARLELEKMLMDFYNKDYGEFKVVIVPSSGTLDIEDLGKQYLEQMKLGKLGKHDGGVLLIIKDRLEDNMRGKMNFTPGLGIDPVMNGNEFTFGVLADYAQPLIVKAEEAQARGNMKEAQRLRDQAVVGTMQRLTQHLAKHVEDNRPLTPEEQAAAAERQKQVIMAILGLLALLGAGAGVSVVAYKKYQAKKRLEANMALVKAPLQQLESGYAVTASNVYSAKTLAALLDTSSGKQAKTGDLEKAIAVVLKNTPAEKQGEAVQVLVEKGLVHPNADIRIDTIQNLVNDGLTRDDFGPFLTLLNDERDSRVINALVDPLTKLATRDDVNGPKGFRALLKASAEPGIKVLSVSVMEKYRDDQTVADFVTALEKETDQAVIGRLQRGIETAATHVDAGLLQANLAQDKVNPVRSAAIGALGKLGKAEYFQPLYSAFVADTDKSLDADYRKALSQTVSKTNLSQLFEGLKSSKVRLQGMAIALLGQLKAPEGVGPLFDYLEAEDTKLPQEATQVLVESVSKDQRPLVLEKIKSANPKSNDKEVMLAAASAIAKIGLAEDMAVLIPALKKDPNPQVSAALAEAMDTLPQGREQFVNLADLIESSPESRVRVAAALSLDDYGTKSLDPLFRALDKAKEGSEIQVLTKAINKITRENEDEALPLLLNKSVGRGRKSADVATKAAAGIIDTWDERHSYAINSPVLQKLVNYSAHENQTIKATAENVYTKIITAKERAIAEVGRTGSFWTSSDDYENMEKLRDNAPEKSIKQAAKNALSNLDSRRRAHEAAEAARRAREAAEAARRAAAAAAAARAAAARRSSYSSSSSSFRSSSSFGGFGGGGSGRAGGGRSI